MLQGEGDFDWYIISRSGFAAGDWTILCDYSVVFYYLYPREALSWRSQLELVISHISENFVAGSAGFVFPRFKC
eukprot:1196104-Prorocentrum_minimum.AAC.1